MSLNERAFKVLKTSPVFGMLEDEVLHDLVSVLKFTRARGGDLVVTEGDKADSLMFVISGGLRVSRRNKAGEVDLYNEIRPGQSIGEIGLILQQPRTSDITAIRDSTLAVLDRSAYEELLLRHPLELNRVFVQTTFDFLRHANKAPTKRHAQTFAVLPLVPEGDHVTVARLLCAALESLGRTFHFRPPDDLSGNSNQHAALERSDLASDLELSNDFIVYEAHRTSTSWTRQAFRQADQVIFVAPAGASANLGEIEESLSNEPGFALKRKHVVLLYPETASAPDDMLKWRGLRGFERAYPLRRLASADFSRLARFLTGTAVGVVLGGGGARGFAHLGVLRALEEAGIPIDLIGGNSMGALIGAQYACDLSLEAIREQTQRFATGGERLTLPVISLVSGKRVQRDLQRMFGDTQIENLWRPYFAAACNLSRGSTSVQDAGPLWKAVLASNSPAGLFPPVLDRGELLVDGAILENVPVAAMRTRLGTPLEKRRGNGTIIAIDVDARESLLADPSLERLSVWQTLRGLISRNAQPSPGIAAILYNAGHIGGANQRGRTVAQSDYFLEPPVGNFSLMAYRRSEEIVDVGYRYAIEQINAWERNGAGRTKFEKN